MDPIIYFTYRFKGDVNNRLPKHFVTTKDYWSLYNRTEFTLQTRKHQPDVCLSTQSIYCVIFCLRWYFVLIQKMCHVTWLYSKIYLSRKMKIKRENFHLHMRRFHHDPYKSLADFVAVILDIRSRAQCMTFLYPCSKHMVSEHVNFIFLFLLCWCH